MRFAVDTGGTFTDLVVEKDDGTLELFKSSTVPEDPVQGVLNALQVAADGMGMELSELLAKGSMFLHGTTRALNAILTEDVAHTALLVTEGHRDILLFREGGRLEPFNSKVEYPDPYIPRALTFEVKERIGSAGDVIKELDTDAAIALLKELKEEGVEAIAVCLLWSIANPEHELRLGELIEEHLPGVPYTLSHQLNPIIREYRRASSTAIDASLKPLMSSYLGELTERLKAAGYKGQILMLTSNGGLLHVETVAGAPIHSINSGPAMAPVAGREYARTVAATDTAIVADTGGTSYDISVVRDGAIPRTQMSWLGPKYSGHMIGFPAVDVQSIGAGGGSIAWVDDSGLLNVGPESAGADPGPACYGRGGTRPTVTDASLLLGILDQDYFLGGAMQIDRAKAEEAIAKHVGEPLGLSVMEAADAILQVTTELMARAIEDVTINQGVDPKEAVLVGGGGAAGLSSAAIATRLGCRKVVIPEVSAALSAAGALLSDLRTDFSVAHATNTGEFDTKSATAAIGELHSKCMEFLDYVGADRSSAAIEYVAIARYPFQAWELDLPLRISDFTAEGAVEAIRDDFHKLHEQMFAISDPGSEVEVIGWSAKVTVPVGSKTIHRLAPRSAPEGRPKTREVWMPGEGPAEVDIVQVADIGPGDRLVGPVIVEAPTTTVVVDRGADLIRDESGSLVITPPQTEVATVASAATEEIA